MTDKNLWFYGASNTAPTSQFNQGPFSFTPSNGRLLQVMCRGMLGITAVAVSPTFVGVEDIIWGAQWGASGFTPASILTSFYGDNWLWRHHLFNDDSRAFWTPDTQGAVDSVEKYLTEKWRGNLQIGTSTIDMYLSWQPSFGVTNIDWDVYGTIEAYWS